MSEGYELLATKELMERWRSRAKQAEAANERVRELHSEDPDGCCHKCSAFAYDVVWPCATIIALDGDPNA